MRMSVGARRLALTVHVTVSVGWIGAVAGFLVLAITGLASSEVQLADGVYLAMNLIGWWVIVPLAVASLLSGVVSSLGTEWGLARHYWVWLKFLITVFATAALLVHMHFAQRVADASAGAPLQPGAFLGDRIQLIAAAGAGLLVLLVLMVLSMYKPRGRTRYGLRKHAERRSGTTLPMPDPSS
jgi:hypothetical protein